MLYLLSPRLWIAAALLAVLAFTHVAAYLVGKGVVKRQWDRDVAEQREVLLKAQEEARKTEHNLIKAREKVEKKYVQQKRKAAAESADADALFVRLRDQLAARDRAAAQAAATTPGVDAGAGLERELFGRCAKALVGLAQEADRLEATVVGLQGYVKDVCQASNKD